MSRKSRLDIYWYWQDRWRFLPKLKVYRADHSCCGGFQFRWLRMLVEYTSFPDCG